VKRALLAAAFAAACTAKIDPDALRFGCSSDADCGKGYACKPQLVQERGVCYRPEECAEAESCNELDDDCNGAVDDGFDLTADDAHCGACGRTCDAGTRCRASSCVEPCPVPDGGELDGGELPDGGELDGGELPDGGLCF
jgi:hypothetical protein